MTFDTIMATSLAFFTAIIAIGVGAAFIAIARDLWYSTNNNRERHRKEMNK